ncbi:phosphatase PAP2 family protein [Bradyrhizobium sp. AUGA SZCCT0124]|uniref:phosphatase PAP2 family protein n=1 Tax=unclassified Bradyrhizobium TaxID=2631580 RepID=UPI003907E83C
MLGHLHGASFSGKREDAFPSGHALHMGALASAVGTLSPLPRQVIRTLAVGLSLTRIVVLAHWRRGCGLRARCRDEATAAPVDRVSDEITEGGRPCRSLRM